MAGQALVGIVQPTAVEGQQIVEREAGSQGSASLEAGIIERNEERQRPHQMWGCPLPYPPFAQGLPHQSQLEIS